MKISALSLLGCILVSASTGYANSSLDQLVRYLKQFDAVALCEVAEGPDGKLKWEMIEVLFGCWDPPPRLFTPKNNRTGDRLIVATCNRKKKNVSLFCTMNLHGRDVVTTLSRHEGGSFGIRVNYKFLKRALSDPQVVERDAVSERQGKEGQDKGIRQNKLTPPTNR